MATQAHYPEFKNLSLPEIQEEIMRLWQDEDTFRKSVEEREGAEPFVFYEGPPSANGMPGIHHVISRTLKDLVCRYKTMRGYRVSRKAGWDTHGLPVELGVEKELGITKEDIGRSISVEDYNQKCREAVMRYKKEWEDITKRMGYWVDMDHPYVTFDTEYMEVLWWCLKELWKKGLLYKSVSIQPYSPAAGTGLSSHELNQPGTYKDVKDTTVVAMFRVVLNRDSGAAPMNERAEDGAARPIGRSAPVLPPDTYFLAWTTTPWTLPSNCGLTVGPNIDYVLVKTYNPYTNDPCNVILAKALLGKWFKAGAEVAEGAEFPLFNAETHNAKAGFPYQILAEFKGRDLENIRYEQLIPLEGNTAEIAGGDPFRVILGDFVTTEDGTGIVHTAPAFGADDYRAGKAANIGILTMVDREGKFVDGATPRNKEGHSIHEEHDLQLAGRFVKNYRSDEEWRDPDVDIAVWLKLHGRAFKVEKYEHSYPHCWRTDKPILYYPLDAWFIKTTAVKDRMIELNKTINWKPKSTGEGRFGNWLENMVDWNLSRSRYWGTPLPVWVSEDGAVVKCIGSIAELKREVEHANKALGMNQFLEATEQTPHESETSRDSFSKEGHGIDLHKPFVDQIILATDDGRPMRREPDLIDVWFDSGAMPYAQWGLPKHKNSHEVTPDEMADHVAKMQGGASRDEWLQQEAMLQANLQSMGGFGGAEVMSAAYLTNGEDVAPGKVGGGWRGLGADFIAEGVDQTRGWFYTLHALGVMLFDDVAYKTVVANGLVLDKNGAKMSKRLGNVVDPFQTIAQHSADATRWYLITNASPWDSLKFDLGGVEEVKRTFFNTIFSTYKFFSLYANVDSFSFKERYIPVAKRPELDRWILSRLNSLIANVQAAYDDYEPTLAGRLLEEFADVHLSNWYVRLSRRRFWKGEYGPDKVAAYQTLYECLEALCLMMAPIAPFFSDKIFRALNGITKRSEAQSVHLADFPYSEAEAIDPKLEHRMELAQDLTSLLLSLRKKADIRVRQPLQKALIPVMTPAMRQELESVEELLKAETNIKEIEYAEGGSAIIRKKAKADFKALGARLGGDMKKAAAAIAAATPEMIAQLESASSLDLDLGDKTVTVYQNEVAIIAEEVAGWLVANKGPLTVALDVKLTPELEAEGMARDLVNRIQKMRKDLGLEVTDRITLQIQQNASIGDAIDKYKSYICAEILADDLLVVDHLEAPLEIDINEAPYYVYLQKI